jgi:hypothetical protein
MILAGTGRATTLAVGFTAEAFALGAGFRDSCDAAFIFFKDCAFALTGREWDLLLFAFEGFDFFGI